MHSASWSVPGESTSAAQCRARARSFLGAWGLDAADLVQDVELVLSELVGNAVRHTGSEALTVALRCDPATRSLLVEVSDASAVPPRPRRAATDEEGGRGMELMTALSHEHGWTSAHGGKTVWARLPLP